ncbi:MAG: HTTM domain-containing protein [Pleurocapsa sp. SU_196_0]|nr:HTTM domain-containing protein [Pleurocapsa sp. SU_196_0]
MLTRFGRTIQTWTSSANPWTNAYGLARTLLALGTLGTLLFSHSSAVFRPTTISEHAPTCTAETRWALFCLASSDHLELLRWLAVILLTLVASGWRPRWTGVVHWWVAWSLNSTGTLVDGGDQITAVLTFLLLPVTLTDPRLWHWQAPPQRVALGSQLIARSALLVIRLQVAVVYFHAAVSKFAVPEWMDGTAVYYWFTDPAMGMPPWLQVPITWLVSNPLTVYLITWGTMLLELALAAGLISVFRYRGTLLVLGFVFHSCIALVHGLISFALAMGAALLLFLLPAGHILRIPWRSSKRADALPALPLDRATNLSGST